MSFNHDNIDIIVTKWIYYKYDRQMNKFLCIAKLINQIPRF